MLASNFYCSDFKFGDKSLSDFGGIIVNKDGWNINNGVTIEATTSDIPARSGKVLVNWKYSERQIEIPILLTEDIDVDEFCKWLLNGEQVLTFTDTNRYINAVLDNTISLKGYLNNSYRADLSFTAYDSFFSVLNEPDIVKNSGIASNTVISIPNKGNIESYPLIKITPSNDTQQEIRFKWNNSDFSYKIANVIQIIYIDCEEEEVYYLDGNGQKVSYTENFKSNDYYDFPILACGTNELKVVAGNISEIVITPKSKIV